MKPKNPHLLLKMFLGFPDFTGNRFFYLTYVVLQEGLGAVTIDRGAKQT